MFPLDHQQKINLVSALLHLLDQCIFPGTAGSELLRPFAPLGFLLLKCGERACIHPALSRSIRLESRASALGPVFPNSELHHLTCSTDKVVIQTLFLLAHPVRIGARPAMAERAVAILRTVRAVSSTDFRMEWYACFFFGGRSWTKELKVLGVVMVPIRVPIDRRPPQAHLSRRWIAQKEIAERTAIRLASGR